MVYRRALYISFLFPLELKQRICRLQEFSSASQECEPWDEEYPLELALQDIVLGVVMKGLATRLQLPEDNINDSEDKRQEKA